MGVPHDFDTITELVAADLLNATWVYGEGGADTGWQNGALPELSIAIKFTKDGGGTASVTVRVEVDMASADGYDATPVQSQRASTGATSASHTIAASGTEWLFTTNTTHCKRWRLGVYANGAGAATDAVIAMARGGEG